MAGFDLNIRIPGWILTHGSPTGSGYGPGGRSMYMWAAGNQGEGILTNVNVVQGQSYIYSTYYSVAMDDPAAPDLDHTYMHLTNSLPAPYPIVIPAGSQQLFDKPDSDAHPYRHLIVVFTAADNYDELWIHPEQAHARQASMTVRNVELSDRFSIDIGPDTTVYCGDSLVLRSDTCGLISGGRWEWNELPSGVVVSSLDSLELFAVGTRSYVCNYILRPDTLIVNGVPQDSLVFRDTILVTVIDTAGDCCDHFANGIVYVDATASGANTGMNWGDAFVDLQDALNTVDTCLGVDEIWVARGSYSPSASDPGVSYELISGVRMYGGFNGSETMREQRDWDLYPSVLSGLLGSNYHIVVADRVSSGTILDGFNIQQGNAQGGGDDNLGGGLFIDAGGAGEESSPVVRNCTFLANRGVFGGAFYVDALQGGASTAVFENCWFLDNEAVFDVSPGTTAQGGGGYIYNVGGDIDIKIEGCKFEGNTATLAAGLYVRTDGGGDTDVLFRDSYFRGNYTPLGYGGGVYSFGASQSFIDLDFANCVFTGNDARRGGAFFITNTVNPIANHFASFVNCTFGSNYGEVYGDAIYNQTSTVEVRNSIFWGNAGNGELIENNLFGSTTVTESIVEGGYVGTGNRDVDPLFVAPLAVPAMGQWSAGGNYQLRVGSPAIDRGDLGYIASLGLAEDILGNPRVRGLGLDQGAYESDFDSCMTMVWDWGNLGDDGIVSASTQLVKDPIGNIYVGGSYSGTLPLGSTSSGFPFALTNTTSNNDAYLAKYAPDGTLIWGQTFTASAGSSAIVRGMDTDGAGFCYVAGSFTGTLSVYMGGSWVPYNSNGNSDMFVVCVSPQGVPQWVRTFGTVGNDYVFDLDIGRNQSSLVIGGSFGESLGGLMNATLSMDLNSLTAAGYWDANMFVAQLALSNGRVNALVGADSDEFQHIRVREVEVADNGDVYVMGTFQQLTGSTGTVFPLSIFSGTSHAHISARDVFFARFGAFGSGNSASAVLGSWGNDEAMGLMLDSNGDPHFAMRYFGSVQVGGTTFDAGGNSRIATVMGKMDDNFGLVWGSNATTGTNTGAVGSGGDVHILEMDGLDNLYGSFSVTNTTGCVIDGQHYTTTNAVASGFVVKYEPSGVRDWTIAADGDAEVNFKRVCPLSDEKLYTAGVYRNGTLDLGNDSGNSSVGDWRLFSGLFEPGVCVSNMCGRDLFEPNDQVTSAALLPTVGIQNTAQICAAGDEDYYLFLTGSTNLNLRVYLYDLETDLDVELYEAGNTVSVGSSNNSGTDAEVITHNNANAGAGYLIRVFGANGNFAPEGYVLRVHQRATPFTTPIKATPTGVRDEVEAFEGVVVYPNPSKGDCHVAYSLEQEALVRVGLYDMYGRAIRVLVGEEAQGAGEHVLTFDVSTLSGGVYLIGLEIDGTEKMYKLIVE